MIGFGSRNQPLAAPPGGSAPPRSRPPIPLEPGSPHGPSAETIEQRRRHLVLFMYLASQANFQPLRERLMFPARSVTVDNLSNQWLWLPDALRYVPPMTSGMTLRLTGAVNRAFADWASGTGATNANVLPAVPNATPTGAGATIAYYEEFLMPSEGRDISHWLPV